MSGARPGTKSQLNESVDSQHLGALENRIEVAIVKTDAARSAHEDCASCFEVFDSLFDRLPGAVCDSQDTLWHKPSDRYVREARPGMPDGPWQDRSISS